MKANELIQVASKIKMGIGRTRSNVYRYSQVVNGVLVENEFHGNWHAFVRFIKARVATAE